MLKKKKFIETLKKISWLINSTDKIKAFVVDFIHLNTKQNFKMSQFSDEKYFTFSIHFFPFNRFIKMVAENKFTIESLVQKIEVKIN